MSRGWAPRWESSARVRRVSSAATSGTLRSSSTARPVRSPGVPSGGATTYSVPPRTASRGEMLLDPGLEGGLLGEPDDGVHVLAVLEEEQRRNRAHVEAHRSPLIGVHVHLGHLDPAGVRRRELFQDRRDGAARTAPFGPEIHQHESLALLHLVPEARVGYVGDDAVGAHIRFLLLLPSFPWPTSRASRTWASPYRTSRPRSRSTATSSAWSRGRSRLPTAPPSSPSRWGRATSSCSPRGSRPDRFPAFSSDAARASTTSATGCPISTRPSRPAGAPATGSSTTSRASGPAGAGSRSFIRKPPPASCSSSPSEPRSSTPSAPPEFQRTNSTPSPARRGAPDSRRWSGPPS